MTAISRPSSRITDLLDPRFMRQIERLDVMSRKILQGKMQGERRSKKRGQSVEFADYRNYVAGDDLRRIDWNLFARLDKLFLRLFVEEEDLSVSVLLDVSKSMDYGEPNKFFYAKQLAAALSYIGLVNYNRVHVYAFADGIIEQLPNLRGRRPIPRVIDFLSNLKAEGVGNFGAATKRFALIQRNKGVVIAISDFMDKGDWPTSLRYLSGDRYDAYMIQVLAPQEIDPEKGQIIGDLRLEDLEDHNIAEVSVGPALIKRYKANLQAYCNQLRSQCVRRQIQHMISDTSVPFDTLVLRYLRERGLLG